MKKSVLIFYNENDAVDEIFIFSDEQKAKDYAEKHKAVENFFFELCRHESHPYHNKRCDRNCPHWAECNRGEIIEREYDIFSAEEIA